MSAKLYVEGGGDSKSLRTACRKGFRTFLEKAKIHRMPRIVACGRRQKAYEDFKHAHVEGKDEVLLLVDSEEEVKTLNSSWGHLASSDQWKKPPNAQDEQCHLMVQCMESWFLADPAKLASYFGQKFQQTALPANPKIEKIPKRDVLEGLKKATRDCQKGRYGKGAHSFEILEELDPELVAKASPFAGRFLEALREQGAKGA